MQDANWIESLALLGHGNPTLPSEVAELHGRPRKEVRIERYTALDPIPIAEGPPWFPFEQQCLTLMFSLMQKISTREQAAPIVGALVSGALTLVPLRHSIEFVSATGRTQMAGYWDAEQKRLYLDREELVYQLTGTAGNAIHEGTHALDPTLDRTLYPGSAGFPGRIVMAAEVMAFTNEAAFHADAAKYFETQRQLPPAFAKWLIDSHLLFQRHAEARARLLS